MSDNCEDSKIVKRGTPDTLFETLKKKRGWK